MELQKNIDFHGRFEEIKIIFFAGRTDIAITCQATIINEKRRFY